MERQFSHSACIFPVADPLATARFYRDNLGFDINFTWGDPPEYIVVNREDAVGIHFVQCQDDFRPRAEHMSLYIFVHQVDKLYQELSNKPVNIISPVKTWDWA